MAGRFHFAGDFACGSLAGPSHRCAVRDVYDTCRARLASLDAQRWKKLSERFIDRGDSVEDHLLLNLLVCGVVGIEDDLQPVSETVIQFCNFEDLVLD